MLSWGFGDFWDARRDNFETTRRSHFLKNMELTKNTLVSSRYLEYVVPPTSNVFELNVQKSNLAFRVHTRLRFCGKSKTKQPLPLVETELRTTTVSTTDLKDSYRPVGQKMKTASDYVLLLESSWPTASVVLHPTDAVSLGVA